MANRFEKYVTKDPLTAPVANAPIEAQVPAPGQTPVGGSAPANRFAKYAQKAPAAPAAPATPVEDPTAFGRGMHNMTTSVEATTRLAAGDLEGVATGVKERAAYNARNPQSLARQELGKAWEGGDGVFGAISDVLAEIKRGYDQDGLASVGQDAYAMGQGIVEQIPNMFAPMTGMGAGALTGSAAGPVGVVAGAFVGGAAGNALVEGGGAIEQRLAENNIDINDTQAVIKFLGANRGDLLKQIGIKGSVLSAVDLATMKLGSAIFRAPVKKAQERALLKLGVDPLDAKAASKAMTTPEFKTAILQDAEFLAANTASRKLARAASAALLEPAGEFAGEYLGEGLSAGNWDTKNAALEALSSIGQSAITTAGVGAYTQIANPVKRLLTETNAGIDQLAAGNAKGLSAQAATAVYQELQRRADNLEAMISTGQATEEQQANLDRYKNAMNTLDNSQLGDAIPDTTPASEVLDSEAFRVELQDNERRQTNLQKLIATGKATAIQKKALEKLKERRANLESRMSSQFGPAVEGEYDAVQAGLREGQFGEVIPQDAAAVQATENEQAEATAKIKPLVAEQAQLEKKAQELRGQADAIRDTDPGAAERLDQEIFQLDGRYAEASYEITALEEGAKLPVSDKVYGVGISRQTDPTSVAKTPESTGGGPSSMDVTTAKGKPFSNQRGLARTLADRGLAETHEVVGVPGGWVGRPKSTQKVASEPAASSLAQSIASDVNEGAEIAQDAPEVAQETTEVVPDGAAAVQTAPEAGVAREETAKRDAATVAEIDVDPETGDVFGNLDAIIDAELVEDSEHFSEVRDGRALFSRATFEDGVKDGYYDNLANSLVAQGYAPAQVSKFMTDITSVSAMIFNNPELLDYTSVGSGVFSALKDNSDMQYLKSEDYTTICRKTLKMVATISEIMQRQKGSLTGAEIDQIRDMLKSEGDVVNCGICYVFSRWMNIGHALDQMAYRDTFIEAELERNAWALKKDVKGFPKKKADLEAKIAEAEAAGSTKPADVKRLEANRKKLKELAPVKKMTKKEAGQLWDDIFTGIPQDLIYDMSRKHELAAKHPAAAKWLRERGAGLGKAIETRTAYIPGLLEKTFTPDKVKVQNLFSGMRMQSWSDFDALHVIDMMQVAAERAKIGLAAHGYTKVPDFVRVMAPTGVFVNMSLIPEGNGFNEDGSLRFDPVEGMPFEEALALRAEHRTAGTIAIGVSDAHIRALLDDPRIDYVIPYHSSGLPKVLQEKLGVGWTDYEKTQTDKIVDQKKANARLTRLKKTISEKSRAEHVMAWEWFIEDATPAENTENFYRYAEESGLAPRFPQFRDHPNAWKLMIDRKMVDEKGKYLEQKATTLDFDMDAINDIFDAYVDAPAGETTVGLSTPNMKVVEQWLETVKKSQGKTRKSVSGAPAPTGVKVADVEADVRGFLGKGYDKLAQMGKVKIVQSADQVPDGVKLYSRNGDVAGVYFDGQVTLVADNIHKGEAAYLMRHEGLHMLLAEDKLFVQKRGEILNQFAAMRDTNQKVREAYARVPSDTGAPYLAEEALAYFLQDPTNHNIGLVRKLIASVKAWFMRHGISFKPLTDADLIAMVNQSLRAFRATDGATGSGPRASRGTNAWYYSALARGAGNIKVNAMPARSWPNALLKQPEVKKEELEWSGLEEWLATQEGSVTKQSVLDFLELGGVQVQDVMKGYSPANNTRQNLSREIENLTDQLRDADQPVNIPLMIETGTERVAEKYRPLADRAVELWKQQDALVDEQSAYGGTDSPTYGQYVLDGGENYREVLLTLPKDRDGFGAKRRAIRDRAEAMQDEAKSLGKGTFVTTWPAELQGRWHAMMDDYNALEDAMRSAVSTTYSSSHWDEKNVLAHIRLNDRAVNGERVLFIEEIQSDWNLEGRKEGFQLSEKERQAITQEYKALGGAIGVRERKDQLTVAFEKRTSAESYDTAAGRYTDAFLASQESKESARLDDLQQAASRLLQLKQSTVGEYMKEFDTAQFVKADAKRKGVELKDSDPMYLVEDVEGNIVFASWAKTKATDRVAEAEANAPNIPTAPFVQDSGWQALALKRVLRMAAEEGYDRVAWVNGEQTAERYSLDKKIDYIGYQKRGAVYNVRAGRQGGTVWQDQSATPDTLERHLGKEIAKRILDGEGRNEGAVTYLEAKDLKIEAKWARALYDTAVPDWMQKFGKKYGAWVDTVDMRAPDLGPERYEVVGHGPRDFGVWDTSRKIYITRNNDRQSFRSEQDAEAFIADMVQDDISDLGDAGAPGVQGSLPITADMRTAIMRGMPLFSRRNQAIPYSELLQQEIPQQTQVAYKLMKLSGRAPDYLFPLYAKPEEGPAQGFEMGKWYRAENQRPSIGGKKLAERAGLHAVDLPIFSQGKANTKNEKRVWVEVLMPAMNPTTQAEADTTPILSNGQRQGIKDRVIAPGEAYNYRTNPNATGAGAWPIAGSMQAVRVLTDAEVAQILKDNGANEHIENSMTGAAVEDITRLNQMGEADLSLRTAQNKHLTNPEKKGKLGVPQEMWDRLAEANQLQETVVTYANSTQRKAITDGIIATYRKEKAATRQERKAHLILGLPASGKSTVADPLVVTEGALLVDSDEFKKRLPEFKNGFGSNQTHVESSRMADTLLARAVLDGDNIIMPVVGGNLESLQRRVGELKKEGYDVTLHYVHLAPEKAVQRVVARYDEDGRLVNPDLVVKHGNNPVRNYLTLLDGGFNGQAYDNDVPKGQNARPIDAATLGRLAGVGEATAPSGITGVGRADRAGVAGSLRGDARQAQARAGQVSETAPRFSHRPTATAEDRVQGQRLVDDLVRANRAKPTLLGNAITRAIRERGGVSLVGQKIAHPSDLAFLAQVYRNPQYETFRVFFTKKGEVIGQTAVSSRLPGVSYLFAGELSDDNAAAGEEAMRQQMAALNADGYWLLHNHPSGEVTGSQEDANMTARFAREIPGFLGHVIINHNKYTNLTFENGNLVGNTMATKLSEGKDKLLSPSKPHPILGRKISMPAHLVTIGRELKTKDGYVSLVSHNKAGIRGILEVPATLTKDQLRLAATVRRFARQSGAQDVFAILPADAPRTMVDLAIQGVERGFLRDAVDMNGYSVPARGKRDQNEFFGAKLTGKKVAEEAPQFSRRQTETPEFKKWFGDSKVVDEQGKPLVVYRGEHGNSDGQFHSRLASLSFGDQDAANTYAMDPNMRTDNPEASRVIPAYLRIVNPVFNDYQDPFWSLGDKHEYGIGPDRVGLAGAIGREAATKFAVESDLYIQNTNNWEENFSADYNTVEELLTARPEALDELYMDIYPILDNPEMVRLMKAAGYDGAIHAGMGETALSTEYRVFDETQVKSAIGNTGAFDATNPDIRFSIRQKATGPGYEAFYDRYQDVREQVVDEYRSDLPDQQWSLIPAARLTKIWKDYIASGVVRDEKGLDTIFDRMMENAARLLFSNEVGGHEQLSPEDIQDQHGIDPEEWDAFETWVVEDADGKWRISDYGLPKVIDALALAAEAETAEERLTYIDMALNVIHQRDDLAARFIAGGSETLFNISLQGEGGPQFSRRDYTPEQQAAIERGGFGAKKRKPAKERWTELTDNISARVRQGVVDQFASLKDLSLTAWQKARMSKASSGATAAAFLHGKPRMVDGAITVDTNGEGLVKLLAPLGNEVDDFFQWIAGNRAEQLSAQERENLFTDDDIAALKSLADGTMADGSDRRQMYQDTFARFNEFKKAILDIARESGLLDAEETAQWDDDFYVPFYRVLEEQDEVRGPRIGGGLVRQQAFKKLKGGTQQLNDLLHNTLMNWEHLIGASLKNNAAKEALTAGEAMGIAAKIPAFAAEKNKQAVYVLENGKRVHYQVDDSLVLEAISAISYVGANNPAMRAARTMKRVFTAGITASPEFRIANLLRDTIQVIAVSPVSPNLFKNLKTGMAATHKDTLLSAQMMAGGATMDFGYQLGGDADAAKTLIRRLQKEGGILVDGKPTEKFTDAVGKMWRWWGNTGNRAENVNRAALYTKMINEGKTHAEAAFAAADVLDFRQGGAWPAVRFLTQVVPFLNARIQGLDKLVRAGVDPKQRAQFTATVGAYTLAAVALYLVFKDDEDYKEREDWDRDAYLWFKLPGSDSAFRIPAPFEVGAIGAMAVRAVEQMVDDQVTGALFRDRLLHSLTQTFSFTPVPQLVQPVLDIYANKNPFTERNIESMGMKNLPATERRRATTSSTAAAASKVMGAVLPEGGTLSPVQIEYLVDGYLGWVGSTTLAGVDMIMRPAIGDPTLPAKRLDQYPVLKRFYRQSPSMYTKYTTQFYDQLSEMNLLAAHIRSLRQAGEIDKARALVNDNRDLVMKRSAFAKAQRNMANVNKRIEAIHRSDLSPEVKRDEIQKLQLLKNGLAKRMVQPTR